MSSTRARIRLRDLADQISDAQVRIASLEMTRQLMAFSGDPDLEDQAKTLSQFIKTHSALLDGLGRLARDLTKSI